MKIVVTGSSGFIGKRMVAALVEKDHDVIAIDRNENNSFGSVKNVSAVYLDIANPKFMLNVFNRHKPEAVIHLAAQASVPFSLKNAYADCMDNVLGTVNVIGAAQAVRCKRIVFASTCALYDPDAELPWTEKSSVRPMSPYGVGKRACELYLQASGLSWVALRYGNVYGPGQIAKAEATVIAGALNHMINGEPFVVNGDGEQMRDWIYVEDVVAANLAALGSDKIGIFNVSTGVGTTLNHALAIMARAIGFTKKLDCGPPVPEQRDIVMSSDKFRERFDRAPVTPIEMGLERTAQAWTRNTAKSVWLL